MSELAFDPNNKDKMKAWAVHLFTASGVVWGLLGLIAVMQQEWQVAFFWMIVATFVDGVDGMLARRVHVKGVLPEFDGALLDNILDYLTYVILPALFFYNHPSLLPENWQLFGAALISLASAYQFCQSDAKTDDHSFKGFPSYWNIVVLYLYFLEYNPWFNLGLLIFLSVMVFVPIKYAYPSRMEYFRETTLFLAIIWSIMVILMVLQIPSPSQALVYGSMFFFVYYLGISLYMMGGDFQERRRARRR